MRVLLALPLLALAACLDTENSDEDSDFEANTMEIELHDLVNEHRASLGLDPIEFDAGFSAIAREHSADMADGSVEFGHDGFDARSDEMADQQPSLLAVGENVVYISAGWDDEAGTIVQGWLDSPGHRENIEDPGWTHGGMGAEQDAALGWYATQLFATY